MSDGLLTSRDHAVSRSVRATPADDLASVPGGLGQTQARVDDLLGLMNGESGGQSLGGVLPLLWRADAGAAALAATAVATTLALSPATATAIVPTLVVAVLAVPAWLVALSLARAYEPRYLFAGSAEIHRVGIAGAAVGVLAASVGWALLDQHYSLPVLGGLALGVLLTIMLRWVTRLQAQRANRTGVTRTRTLVVGDKAELELLVPRLHRNLYHGWRAVASCTPEDDARDTVLDVPVRLGSSQEPASIVEAARRCHADVVLLAPSGGARLGSIVELQRDLQAEGRDVALAPPLVESIGPRVSVDSVCGLPVVRIRPPELAGPRQVLKTTIDRIAAGTAVLLLLPVFLVLGLVIRLESRGPALFRQVRVGRGGRHFTMLKFRTMFVDAEARKAALEEQNEGAGPLFKLRHDPRITRLGGWLRRASLDELPQLINIARGDMSLVGPRPALPREVEQYDPVACRRLLVRPGLTGLWQVHGRSDLSWEESRRLDVRYVENWSLGFDLSIVMRTIAVVLRGKGAY